MSFRYPSYRDFKSYAGRVSAVYELIEIAVRRFEKSAAQSGDEEEFITTAATELGLHVHFAECPSLHAIIVSLHIVNVHEAFERFFRALRLEIQEVLQFDWTDYDKKDSLSIAILNVFGTQKLARMELGEMQVDLCAYYRQVRNAAVHVERDPASLMQLFGKVKDYRDEAVRQYETITAAPNPPHALTRDDFQLFVRVTQDVAWGFSQKLKPDDLQFRRTVEKLIESFDKRWPNKPDRVRTAAVNFLCKTYGIDTQEADRILNQVH